jgi:hypothetical protein
VQNFTISRHKFTIANIYGPNEDEPLFFELIRSKLEQFENYSIILGGDYNAVQDFILDTLNIQNRNNQNSHESVLNLKRGLDLIDPWREENPDFRVYTWHNSQNKPSRLDYFLISSDITNYVETTNIKPGYRSDHLIVELTLSLNKQPRGIGLWNSTLLKDNNYVDNIKECMQNMKDQYSARNVNLPNEDPANYTVSAQLLFEMIKLEVSGKTMAYATAKKGLMIDKKQI